MPHRQMAMALESWESTTSTAWWVSTSCAELCVVFMPIMYSAGAASPARVFLPTRDGVGRCLAANLRMFSFMEPLTPTLAEDVTSEDTEAFDEPGLDDDDPVADTVGNGTVRGDPDTTGESEDSRSGQRTSATLSKSLVRRIVVKATELTDAPAAQRALLAHLLGTADSVPELTAAVFTAGRSFTTSAVDLRSIGDADPMEAGVAALSLPKPRLKAVWALLVVLHQVKGTPPTADAKAALAVAKAVHAMPKESQSDLDTALALARRS